MSDNTRDPVDMHERSSRHISPGHNILQPVGMPGRKDLTPGGLGGQISFEVLE